MTGQETSLAGVFGAAFGALGIHTRVANGRRELWEIRFLPPGTPLRHPADPVAEQCSQLLGAYFSGAPCAFPPDDLPLAARGTAFQQRVWSAIGRVPPGHPISYGELAARVGSVPRAVGQACGANPFPVLVPCHRVVAASGTLGGFAHQRSGYLLDAKAWLLAFEAP